MLDARRGTVSCRQRSSLTFGFVERTNETAISYFRIHDVIIPQPQSHTVVWP
jgi:hypothetical protein